MSVQSLQIRFRDLVENFQGHESLLQKVDKVNDALVELLEERLDYFSVPILNDFELQEGIAIPCIQLNGDDIFSNQNNVIDAVQSCLQEFGIAGIKGVEERKRFTFSANKQNPLQETDARYLDVVCTQRVL